MVIDGFRRSFDKKGLRVKKKGILQSMVIKEPLSIDYENESVEDIIEKLEYAIEQHPSFLKVLSQEDLLAIEEENQQRRWRAQQKKADKKKKKADKKRKKDQEG